MVVTKFWLFAIVASACLIEINAFSLNPDHLIKLRLYNKDFTYKEVIAKNGEQLVQSMNKLECTQFYAHGYIQSLDSPIVQSLLKEFLAKTPCNIIGIEYKSVTYQLYPTSVLLANAVAKQVAIGIKKMVAAGMDKSKLILSGFSLGGQLSGDIARHLPFTVPEIRAFDPAGPMFGFIEKSLNPNDATCIKCIHTNAGLYGTNIPCGHIDFYPNGGKEQNGCKVFQKDSELKGCSHSKAAEYTLEAFQNPGSFLGVKCNSYDDFKAGKCDRSVIVPWGVDTPCNLTGKFFLQTNANSPYGRGSAGTVYDASIDK